MIMVWLFISPVHAQKKTEKHISFKGKEMLALDIQIADSIRIHTWSKDETYIISSVNINNNMDNDAYQIDYKDAGNSIEVKGCFRKGYFKDKSNSSTHTDIFWDVWIPDNKYFTVETINANITIEGHTDRMKVKTISGYIDLSVPSGKNADVDFSTITGTIYSNHSLSSGSQHSGIPTKITDRLNKGGSLIKLETISGDIYFRKAD
jgi:hypothetical protein